MNAQISACFCLLSDGRCHQAQFEKDLSVSNVELGAGGGKVEEVDGWMKSTQERSLPETVTC